MKNYLMLAGLLAFSSAFAGGAAAPMSLPAQQVKFISPSPSFPLTDAVQVGNILFLSGQTGTDASGKLVPGGIKAETLQVLTNIDRVLQKSGYTRANLVRCNVMLADIKDFAGMNEVYSTWLGKPYPARATFAIASLVGGASVEIECTAAR